MERRTERQKDGQMNGWNRRKLYTPSAYFVCLGYNNNKNNNNYNYPLQNDWIIQGHYATDCMCIFFICLFVLPMCSLNRRLYQHINTY